MVTVSLPYLDLRLSSRGKKLHIIRAGTGGRAFCGRLARIRPHYYEDWEKDVCGRCMEDYYGYESPDVGDSSRPIKVEIKYGQRRPKGRVQGGGVNHILLPGRVVGLCGRGAGYPGVEGGRVCEVCRERLRGVEEKGKRSRKWLRRKRGGKTLARWKGNKEKSALGH